MQIEERGRRYDQAREGRVPVAEHDGTPESHRQGSVGEGRAYGVLDLGRDLGRDEQGHVRAIGRGADTALTVDSPVEHACPLVTHRRVEAVVEQQFHRLHHGEQ